MDLGEGHELQLTQKYNLMYDRFVPYLGEIADAKNVENAVIVDIGANVGDTVAALIRHTAARVICVEPTQKFLALCQKNVKNFGAEYYNRIAIVNAYVSDDERCAFVSEKIKGTAIKTKVAGGAEAPTYTLPHIVEGQGYDMQQVALIKVDTDGYDADCIFSLGDSLANISPVLFWENQIDTNEQHSKYRDMGGFLNANGYSDYFIFDNYGNFLCHTDVDGYLEVNDYLKRILNNRSTRSFFYVDVLAAKKEDCNICRGAIKNYLQQYS